jgi:hypothetical protein
MNGAAEPKVPASSPLFDTLSLDILYWVFTRPPPFWLWRELSTASTEDNRIDEPL